MRVFVTGGAGYIGSVVIECLIDAGNEVTAFDNLQTGHRAAVHEAARFIEGDVLDARAVHDALSSSKPDVVMHLAAESVVSESYAHPAKFFHSNVCGGVHVLEAMRASQVDKIVYSSTAAVYGEPELEAIDEDAPARPVNPYGESKFQFERILELYERLHGFQHVSLRYFNASGATNRNGEDRPAETHLIPILLDAAAGRWNRFKLFGTDYPTRDGTCVRDYVHVSDIAKGHLLVLPHLGTLRHRVYNLGSGTGSTNREVLAAVRRETGCDIPVEEAARRPGDPASLVASASRIRSELGWSADANGLSEIVRSAWAWRQAHPHGYGGKD